MEYGWEIYNPEMFFPAVGFTVIWLVSVDEVDLPLSTVIQYEETNEDDLLLSSSMTMTGVLPQLPLWMMTPGDRLTEEGQWRRTYVWWSKKEEEAKAKSQLVIRFTEPANMLEQLQTYCHVSNKVAFLENIMICRKLITKKLFSKTAKPVS